MANEAVVIELYGENSGGAQRRFTCASGVKISKGTILALTDPRTAAALTTPSDIFAGIASMDKEADDLSTSISAWENGIFDMTASGAIAIGQKVFAAGANQVYSSFALASDSSFAIMVGVALEAATDGEVINVRVNN